MTTKRKSTAVAFAVAIFVSAFLLFQVQPLISKCILPWFGGTPAVWTTCMLFFQSMLFAGYLYAHLTTRYFRPRWQVLSHALLLLAAIALLPILPDAAWKPAPGDEPISRIVLMLTAAVGLPFFLLSATGPLLQRWFSFTEPDASPYRLYALSNVGSLLALISYPFVFEPALATQMQAVSWSLGFILFALLCGWCGSYVWHRDRNSNRVAGVGATNGSKTPDERALIIDAPTLGQRLLWFALAMAASVMLLATTNQVCLDVASVPFLWVLPLTLYLLTFILCFDSERWYSRRLYAMTFAVSMAGVTVMLLKGSGGSLISQVVVYFAGLFFCCMICHGELVKLKPHPQYLTSFYLLISAGGAAGGLFVGVLAPLVFPTYLELHAGILGSVALAALLYLRNRPAQNDSLRFEWRRVLIAVGVGSFAIGLAVHVDETFGDSIAVSRNFYGVLRVEEKNETRDPKLHHRALMHGRIVHGMQFTAPYRQLLPTAYYGEQSGVGRVLLNRGDSQSKRVGVVGLGVGTVAVYGRPGDYYRFYEINSDVIDFAESHFTFLKKCAADYDIVQGDARLSLEHEEPQRFDVLVLDAFSGDAIPAHLLTREAVHVYRRHLSSDGILAVHISNLHFDLRPVIEALAEETAMQATAVFAHGDEDLGTKNCLWMLLSLGELPFETQSLPEVPLPPNDRRILWTDDSSNLFEILR